MGGALGVVGAWVSYFSLLCFVFFCFVLSCTGDFPGRFGKVACWHLGGNFGMVVEFSSVVEVFLFVVGRFGACAVRYYCDNLESVPIASVACFVRQLNDFGVISWKLCCSRSFICHPIER